MNLECDRYVGLLPTCGHPLWNVSTKANYVVCHERETVIGCGHYDVGTRPPSRDNRACMGALRPRLRALLISVGMVLSY